MDFLSQQFGRVLLVVALAWAGTAIYLNRHVPLEPIPETALKRPVTVELKAEALSPVAAEAYFLAGPGTQYAFERFVFAEPLKVQVFEPIALELPPTQIMRPAQLLPDPGPTLEGSHKLPRFGDELPPVAPVAPPARGTGGTTPGK